MVEHPEAPRPRRSGVARSTAVLVVAVACGLVAAVRGGTVETEAVRELPAPVVQEPEVVVPASEAVERVVAVAGPAVEEAEVVVPVAEAVEPVVEATAQPDRWLSHGEGTLGLTVNARSSYDRYTSGGHWDWLGATFDRMVVFEPYWDTRLDSYRDVLVYQNAYGISVNTTKDRRAIEHPEWILRDANGDAVYIPFACGGGCPRYAADIGDPGFRADFLDYVAGLVDRGYPGLMLDDVNFEWRFGTVDGGPSTPIDPRTGAPLELEDWRRYFTEFLELIRAEFPDLEIMHNIIWFSDSPGLADPLIDRAIRSADVIALERGYGDGGLEGGGGRWGIRSFMAMIDRIHENGAAVVLVDKAADSAAVLEYNLGGALLTSNGHDAITSDVVSHVSPSSLWGGFDTDLGAAVGERRFEDGVHRRAFSRGAVFLTEPGAARTTIELGQIMRTLDGRLVQSITLGPREAAVLFSV